MMTSMRLTDHEIRNPRTGQRMRFLRTATDTDGALLRIETVNPPPGAVREPVNRASAGERSRSSRRRAFSAVQSRA